MIDKFDMGNGQTLKIFQDMSSFDPRDDDNLSEMYCFHNNYSLGDNHHINGDNYGSFDEMVRDNTTKSDIILNLYLYDHGGITISHTPFGCRFDSGQVGFAVVPIKTIIHNYGDNSPESREKALACMIAEIETYDMFLTGSVYGFTITEEETCNLGHTHETEIDSCWGFFGYDHEASGLFDHAGYKTKETA